MGISLLHIRKVFCFTTMVLLLASCASNSVKPPPSDVRLGEVSTRTYFFEEAGKDMSYALYVPSTYDGSRETPLVVLLHGLTSNPTAVIGYEGLTAQAEKHGMIVVAPFGYNEGGWYGSRGHGNDFGMETANMFTKGAPANLGELSELDVLNVMEIIRKEFTIDNNRTYLVGHSMGGAGTLYLGIKYSDQWAALAQMSPAVFGGPRGSLDSIKNVPILTIQGEKDELVPVTMVRELVSSFDAAGLSSKYIEIPGGDHVRVIARNPDLMAEVFNFLAAHSR